MRALVTGGRGFIGSHLAARLVADGHEFRVLDNSVTGRGSNIHAIGGDVELVEERAAARLGYEADVDLRHGLSRTIESYREQRASAVLHRA